MSWISIMGLAASFAASAPQVQQSPATGGSGPAVHQEAEIPQLDGVLLTRPDGGVMQMKMEGVHLVLRFYDAEHKPVKPDVDRASVRLKFPSRAPERFTLVPMGDGMALSIGRPIRPPHVFKAYIGLFRGESDSAVESYVADFPAR